MNFRKLTLAIMGAISLVSHSQFNYGEALQKSILFYEAQQSGELPEWNRVSWRDNSAVNDGADVNHDLTGGWYDAGDHVKFGFPMAFSVTALAWGAIEYPEAYQSTGQLEILKRNLRFVTDYFIKCHTAPNEFYGQLGNGSLDHAFWGASEVMMMERPSYKVDAANPGTELAAETAAAMAAVSMLYANDDPAYSATLLQHAEQLYNFADTYRGKYSDAITDAAAFYNSWSGYQDELVWGAIWLYRATGDSSYLAKAESEYQFLGTEIGSNLKSYKWGLAWDDKSYGCYILMSMLTNNDAYKADAERHLDYWTDGYNGERISYSPGGQAHLTTWGSLRHSSNTALLAFIYSDKVETTKADIYHDFAVNQINYALGDNPLNRSFMVGFGNDPANSVHHRGAHGPWSNSLQDDPVASSHVLYGALAGGPSAPDDTFEDDRGDYIANEVACDYNAAFTGALARMYSEFGGNPLANFPQPEEPNRAELRSFSKFNSNNAFGSTVSIMFQNRTAWPARTTDNISMRYFFDISEAVAAGNTIDDISISLSYSQSSNSSLTINEWDAENNIYYADISLAGNEIAPVGDPAFRYEVQIQISTNNSPYDTSNDWSAIGLNDTASESPNIPVYDNGVLVFGNEPDGGETPVASFTATPITGVAPLTVNFDASESSDPNGDSLTYSWDFGNGETSSLVNPSIIFEEIGSFLVTLTVSDGVNTSSPVTQTITVEDGNIAPVAIIDADPISGIAPVVVSFDASGSSDANDDDLTYTWDFGDGTTDTGISVTHEYTEIDEYDVVLTVSDGSKEGIDTITITVTDGSPVANLYASETSGVAPLEVTFDASASVDPTENGLTYFWDFGNGVTASTAEATIVYEEIGDFVVTLTVTNVDGVSDSETTIISVNDGSFSCAFDTPTASALPSINSSFENVYVLGEGGPNLDNVSALTINWDLDNSGLYQFSINTNNGQPNWWNDLMGNATQNFNSANPSITISGSDFAGLDGSYYATIDEGNFVLVSQSAPFTIYFSNSATAPECSGSVVTPVNVAPVASLIATPVSGTEPLEVTFDASGSTDEDGDTLTYSIDYGDGTIGVEAVSTKTYTAGLYTATVTVSDGNGGIDTASVDILVEEDDVVVTPPSTEDCAFGAPMASALSSINASFENIYVLGTGGPLLDNVSAFTINWSLENNGVYQFSMNTNNGQPNWYVDLMSGLTQNFNSANPMATISGSGISGLDGSYYVTIDNGNFVMVSTTGFYTIYFSSTSQIPNCGDAQPANENPIASFTASQTTGVAPLEVMFDASNSSDPEGESLTYAWDFGDGTTAAGITTNKIFEVVGTYSVVLTVTDPEGLTDVDTITISVNDDSTPGGGGSGNPIMVDNEYIDRFLEMRDEIYAVENGYFSIDGSPHHSVESLIVEAPDHGHESTSELYSYWMWFEAMYGRISGDWTQLQYVWDKTEEFIIPTNADQPTNSAYSPSSPAAYAPEFPLPSGYPAPLEFTAPTGVDPVSADLTATYGADVYQMHWLLDNDNFYGYGNRGDGVSTPSYINTFQRGEQESVYETIPHPSWESFDWGGANGFLPLFTLDANYSQQWRYTSATDADARAVQAMYWALQWANDQGLSSSVLDLDKATKMGDYLRLGMFDKYFKPMGVQSATTGAGTGYDSAHYLMSWYISWGGAADTSAPWAFRISSSHCHFGYQNPVAAYALTQIDEMLPTSQNGVRDWNISLQRQMEFYTWLQSVEGGIAGGATNSWNGNYSQYPTGKATFYGMAYDDNPVYHDPGSGTWFGWQAWSMERIAEYYYITNDPMAKTLIDKWTTWVESEIQLVGDNDFLVPATLEWTGEPDTWDADNPGSNSNLHVTVTDYSVDLGIAASAAKALIYYAAATEKYETLDTGAKNLAKEILDRMWITYRDDKGCSSTESRGDFARIFEEEVFVPQGFNGVMGNGEVVEPGVSFLDIRSGYLSDPDYPALLEAYEAGVDYTQNYHRTWAQMEIALANAEYGFFFGEEDEAAAAKSIAKVEVSTYPNPTADFVNITVNNADSNLAKNIVVVDITGTVVLNTTTNEATKTIDVSKFAKGIYLVSVYVGNNKIKTSKIVVK